MILEVQLLGLLFGAIMLYLTFLYYKREDYGPRGLAFWTAVWLAFMFVIAFPSTLYGIMESLRIQRTMDFFAMAGFLFFSVVIFHIYRTTKKLDRRIERLVRELAIKK
jgi:hypothetical protein